MSIIMSGHETCKNGKKIERKNSWGRECICSSHRPQKSMKNLWINIKEEKFKILLENWSRYRSEEISPGIQLLFSSARVTSVKLQKHHSLTCSLLWPHCPGLRYWHYQLVLTWYLHQPESHKLSFNNVTWIPDSSMGGPPSAWVCQSRW